MVRRIVDYSKIRTTYPVYMEEGVTDINDDNNGKNGDIKEAE